MKGSRWFVLAMVVVLVVTITINLRMPNTFSWTPTFAHEDENPFGCVLFDSVLHVSLKDGYRLSGKSFQKIYKTPRHGLARYIKIASEIEMDSAEAMAMLQLVKEGNCVLLAADDLTSDVLENTLEFRIRSIPFDYSSLRDNIQKNRFAKIKWTGGDLKYPARSFSFHSSVCNNVFDIQPKEFEVLATRYAHDTVCVAMSIPYGKGKVIVSSTPLLFTNYGMLQKGGADYIFRILSETGSNMPIIRLIPPVVNGVVQSPFSYIVTQRALRLALYITVLSIFVFLLTSARRRQWAIPVMHPVKSHTLEFVQLIGTLYYHRHDNVDLVRKRMKYFSEEIRREYRMDIHEKGEVEDVSQMIAERTGVGVGTIRALLKQIHEGVADDIDDDDTCELIDLMDSIIKKGKI